jgi:glycosyltransferase involved in cell wall biosynthesis
MISVLILTLNEEANLPACLESVKWSDDIVVFDSLSSDRTVEMAKAAEARVVQRKFDNYSAQRNAALKVDFKYPWVLMVDADEVVPDDLHVEIVDALTKVSQDVEMFRLRRKDLFLGKWLRRSGGYPTWFPRLFRVGCVWVEREINEEMHCKGAVANLAAHLVHYPFNKGIAFWLERHNRYSSMEAVALAQETRTKMRLMSLFSRDPVVRRKGLKQLAYRLPCRPLIVFVYLYVIRMGFLDGAAGLRYCRMRAIYEYMIDLKVMELHRREKGQPV